MKNVAFSGPIGLTYSYLEFPVPSHCNHFPDMGLDLYHCPQFFLIRSETIIGRKCRRCSQRRLLPSDQAASAPGLQEDNVSAQMSEFVA